MKIKAILSLSSDDIAEPYKDCRLYTLNGDALGFGNKTIAKRPISTVVEIEIDVKTILQDIKRARDGKE
jgi:hypothetical protein